MMTLLITLIFMLTVVAAMAIGVIMGRKPIKGSCGGVGAALGEPDYTCELCGGDPNKCEEVESGKGEADRDMFYEAGGSARR